MSALTIYVDFKSPASWLAFGPVLAMADELGIAPQWRALPVKPPLLPAREAVEDRGTSHRRVRAQARRDTHALYARVQGIPLTYPTEFAATDLALSLIESLEGDILRRYLRDAFTAYWRDGADLDDPDVVAGLYRNAGAAGAPLPTRAEAQTRIADASARALDEGVVDAPGFVVSGEVFIGREHLPWIRELLAGA